MEMIRQKRREDKLAVGGGRDEEDGKKHEK